MFNSVQRLRLISCLRSFTLNRSNIIVAAVVPKHKHLTEINFSNFSTDSIKMASKPLHTNRLAKEKSPYLLQHKNNPVDWYPWSDEAIQKAKTENKLIFLSVGYSTCHWCHVMEHESFENEEVAKIMNEHYINIKVDREERPDIDKIYMTFVLMINGSGGWPMSVWLTPDLAPVTAGTYFPPTDRWGMPGFKTVLLKIVDKWKDNGEELATTGMNIMQAIQKNAAEKDKEESGETLSIEDKFQQAISIYKRNSDKEWGGFGRAPKFPEVSKINLLFHCHFKKPDCQVIDLVLLTLTKMANGGIHDQIFGGFARYSVDSKWHIPHFEKMLYDQGQLLSAYSNAYRLTRNPFFLDICDNIVKYLCTDLKHPGGGFYSGEDADSLPKADDKIKIEGAFYAWTYSEIQKAFQENGKNFNFKKIDPFIIYAHHYDIRENGNVEPSSDPHGHLEGKNILFVDGDIEETSRKFEIEPIETDELLRAGNKILYEIRLKRPRPHLDTKIICAWNGLVLSGLSKLACIKDAPRRIEYLSIAKKLVDFIKKNLYDEKNKVLMRSCYGEGTQSEAASMLDNQIDGFLDDYSFLIKGLLDYYVATLDKDALHWAKELQDTQDKLFWDDKNSGYFYSQADAPNVIIRLKEDHDGAEPCGNSMAVHNLLLLSCYFEESHYKERAKQIFDFFENATPFGYVLPHMMSGLLMYDFGLEMLVVVGPENDDSNKLIETVRDFFIPGLVPFHLKVEEPIDLLTRKSVQQFKMIADKPTVYVCHNQVCQLPITEVDALAESLGKKYIYKCDY